MKKSSKINGIIIFNILIILLLTLQTQAGTIQNSNHDLTAIDPNYAHTGRDSYNRYNDYKSPCAYCHTPHNSSSDGPLWNRPLPTGPYTTYDSSSLDSSTSSINTQSLLCLSCHDGTIAVDSVLNKPGNYMQSDQHRKMNRSGGIDSCYDCHDDNTYGVTESFLTQDLSDDHPVSFTYNSSLASADGELKDPSSASSGLGGTIAEDMLVNDKLECTSCHNVHDPQYEPFLIKSNSGSSLCFTCHTK